MSGSPSDSVESNSAEIPDVLRTLAGVLPRFTGPELESQLQTYDTFLTYLSPSVRPGIAALLKDAATKTSDPESRQRIETAASSVESGGCAAEAYNHSNAMKQYQESFRASFPNATFATESQPDTAKQDAEPPLAIPPPAPGPERSPGEKRRHPEILAKLDQIEAEMKKINYWADPPPADFVSRVERGELKSYLDAPTFELWLQVVLLPRARHAVEEDELPSGSQVGEMARRQYDHMSIDYNAETLLRLLQEFDELVIQAGSLG